MLFSNFSDSVVTCFFVQNSSCKMIRILVRILVRIQITFLVEFFGQMTSAIFALISQFSHTKWCWFTLIFVYTDNTALFLFFTFSAVASLLCHSHFFFVDIMKLFSHKSSMFGNYFFLVFVYTNSLGSLLFKGSTSASWKKKKLKDE